MSRRAHQPDPSLRRQVEALAAYGIPETDISQVVNVDPKTLRKYYRAELDFGETKANAQVAGFLFDSARNGNVTAQIFWLKTRARWKEVPAEHRHSGAVGSYDLSKLTDDEIVRIVASFDKLPESREIALEIARRWRRRPANPSSERRPPVADKAIDGSRGYRHSPGNGLVLKRLLKLRENLAPVMGEAARHLDDEALP